MSQTSTPLLPLVLSQVPPVLREALAQAGIPTCPQREGEVAGRFVLYDSRCEPRPRLVAGQMAIDVDSLRHATALDPFEALDDERSHAQVWRFGDIELREEIARVDKRRVRRDLLMALRRLIERAGGVWLTLAPYPFPYRSAFTLRIDHDEYEAGDFDTVLARLAGFEGATSHYVCGATHEPHPDALARLRDFDVGSHGYRHHVYRETEENLSNIRRGIDVLVRAGIQPSGFVAPHGRYHRGLRAAMEALRITHSSEFGLVYDELPLYTAQSSVLQIPVHPICLGLFLEADERQGGTGATAQLAAERATAHFERTANAKYRAGEPLFFYGHPSRRLGRFPQVITSLFEAVSTCAALWKTNFSEFAAWWRVRRELRVQVFASGDGYVVVAPRREQAYRMGVEYWRGDHVALMPLDEPVLRFRPQMLAFQPRRFGETPNSVRIDGPQPLRQRVLRYLDWERETPLSEIGGRSWRNVVKRTLRRWKG